MIRIEDCEKRKTIKIHQTTLPVLVLVEATATANKYSKSNVFTDLDWYLSIIVLSAERSQIVLLCSVAVADYVLFTRVSRYTIHHGLAPRASPSLPTVPMINDVFIETIARGKKEV